MSCNMGPNRTFNRLMSMVGATLVLLLLVLEAPVFSSARFVVENLSSDFHYRRGLSESSETRTIAIDLLHVDHVNSRSGHANLTSLERAQNAVKRSKQRLDSISSKILRKNNTFGVNYAFSSPVYSGQSDYVMQVSVGTPYRTFLASMDTGSDLVWLQCLPCKSCFEEPDPVYDPASSTSYAGMPCTDLACNDLPVYYNYPGCSAAGICLYEYEYGDQSYTIGNMAYETFTFASDTSGLASFTNVAFGCGSDNGGLFQGVDGLVGLATGPLSLVSQLDTFIGGVFSYCLVSYASAVTKTSPLLLGSVGNLILIYTPLIPSVTNPYYYVSLVGITVDDQNIVYPADTFDIDPLTGEGGFIIDSGTTVTHLFDAAYTPFLSAIEAVISYPPYTVSGFDLCYDTSSVVGTPVFPTVGFQFDGVDLTLPSDNVFLPVDTLSVIYCMFFASTGVNGAVSIFGNVQQQNFQIAYDVDNSQVGFAGTVC